MTVASNRYDRLDGVRPETPPEVSVVVTHYADQRRLDLVLAGLAAQTHPAARLQVVVADDGSPTPPTVPPGVVVVTQDDLGFRAAAARNLGAAAADGAVLCFLDGDTVPEPAYVETAVRLPAVCADAVVVGRRRHADLPAPQALPAFFAGPVGELAEPAWLVEAYARSRDLLDADVRSYRYVLSAVLTLHRDLFAEVGGFDPTFVGYGGEDWELAHRLWCAGAVLVHERRAVAWHDGGEWATRHDPDSARRQKNAETLALARRLPDPLLRGPGPWPPYAAVVATLATSGDEAADVLAVRGLLAGGDVAVYVDRPLPALAGDARVRVGPVPADVAARAPVTVTLDRPVLLDVAEAVARLVGDTGLLTGPGVVAAQSRALARARRHGVDISDLFAVGSLDATEVTAPDLARELPNRSG